MDDQQQQRINKAAQVFTDALVAAYRTAYGNTVVAQQVGARPLCVQATLGSRLRRLGDLLGRGIEGRRAGER